MWAIRFLPAIKKAMTYSPSNGNWMSMKSGQSCIEEVDCGYEVTGKNVELWLDLKDREAQLKGEEIR